MNDDSPVEWTGTYLPLEFETGALKFGGIDWEMVCPFGGVRAYVVQNPYLILHYGKDA